MFAMTFGAVPPCQHGNDDPNRNEIAAQSWSSLKTGHLGCEFSPGWSENNTKYCPIQAEIKSQACIYNCLNYITLKKYWPFTPRMLCLSSLHRFKGSYSLQWSLTFAVSDQQIRGSKVYDQIPVLIWELYCSAQPIGSLDISLLWIFTLPLSGKQDLSFY